ncbi:hypothetical protein [Cohnella ginsengisoli]|uniref:hypothetical protein n=1 Tax=Cohnella ginsengisoli TaxID=425004 RepID=UPI0030B91A87
MRNPDRMRRIASEFGSIVPTSKYFRQSAGRSGEASPPATTVPLPTLLTTQPEARSSS